MSYHYNDAFENPDYRFSETLEVDRSRNSQGNRFFRQNPYDSLPRGYQGEHSRKQENVPPAIPMASLRHSSEYSESLPRVEVLSRSPYGKSQGM
ncbi:hypothetical protein ASZ78_002289 [Callipepla squamata]|uniref:Uncharacterized protein n=1 Tax=Callipepla squamata TaxID=9009 RepID=A0A226NN33_CALSU|nr:hypothetical protein ASZ78_002289 [Callipepla squamata]